VCPPGDVEGFGRSLKEVRLERANGPLEREAQTLPVQAGPVIGFKNRRLIGH
jgi:hypothetical protein